LCRDGLQEIREAECLEVALVEDDIAYRGSVRDGGPSTSIPSPSTGWGDISVNT